MLQLSRRLSCLNWKRYKTCVGAKNKNIGLNQKALIKKLVQSTESDKADFLKFLLHLGPGYRTATFFGYGSDIGSVQIQLRKRKKNWFEPVWSIRNGSARNQMLNIN